MPYLVRRFFSLKQAPLMIRLALLTTCSKDFQAYHCLLYDDLEFATLDRVGSSKQAARNCALNLLNCAAGIRVFRPLKSCRVCFSLEEGIY